MRSGGFCLGARTSIATSFCFFFSSLPSFWSSSDFALASLSKNFEFFGPWKTDCLCRLNCYGYALPYPCPWFVLCYRLFIDWLRPVFYDGCGVWFFEPEEDYTLLAAWAALPVNDRYRLPLNILSPPVLFWVLAYPCLWNEKAVAPDIMPPALSAFSSTKLQVALMQTYLIVIGLLSPWFNCRRRLRPAYMFSYYSFIKPTSWIPRSSHVRAIQVHILCTWKASLLC